MSAIKQSILLYSSISSTLPQTQDNFSIKKSPPHRAIVSPLKRFSYKPGYCSNHPQLEATYITKTEPYEYFCIRCGNLKSKQNIPLEFINNSNTNSLKTHNKLHGKKVNQMKQILSLCEYQEQCLKPLIQFFKNPNQYFTHQQQLIKQFYDAIITHLQQSKSNHILLLEKQKFYFRDYKNQKHSEKLEIQLKQLYRIVAGIDIKIQYFIQPGSSFDELKMFLVEQKRQLGNVQKQRSVYQKWSQFMKHNNDKKLADSLGRVKQVLKQCIKSQIKYKIKEDSQQMLLSIKKQYLQLNQNANLIK